MTTSVGIVGLDYCGSTLINNILSGLPNCIGAGETHWIVDRVRNPKQTGRCTECYLSHCPVFSDETLEKMQDEEQIENGNWWQTISDSARVDVVVSGDKRPRHYERFGVPDKLLLIVKDPRSHIVSWARRKYPPADGSHAKAYHQGETNYSLTDEQFENALKFWIRETRRHITWSIDSGKPLAVISLESFVQNDELNLKSLSNWLGVDCDLDALKYWETGLHYIGGNHSVKRLDNQRYFFKQIKIDKRWESVLTESQANSIISNQSVLAQLDRLKPYLIGRQQFIH